MTEAVLSGLIVLALTEEAAAGPGRLLSLWGADVRRIAPHELVAELATEGLFR